MSKIYSRPRLKIPEITKKKKFLKLCLIILVAFSTVKIVLNAILPIFNTICQDKAKSIATIISNEQASIVMKKHKYEEFFIIERDENGNIKMLKSNVISINEIISDIAIKIQNAIDEKGKDNVGISIGSFTGLTLFSGSGPSIPISISCIGNVETELKSEFESQGINQTLHRVYLNVDCEIGILTPYNNIKEKISNQILIMENVIVGNVPFNK